MDWVSWSCRSEEFFLVAICGWTNQLFPSEAESRLLNQSNHGLPAAKVGGSFLSFFFFFFFFPCSGELRTQKLKSHLVRTQSLNVLPFKPGVDQYIAINATLTARDFFLAYFYPSGPFTCIFFQNLFRFFLCWLWLIHGSCVGPQNKKGHPAGGRFPCWVPAEYK